VKGGPGALRAFPDFVNNSTDSESTYPIVVADDTKQVVLALRVVTSMTIRVQSFASDTVRFSYTFFCESNRNDAWHVIA
jgi:hypothetical protein